MTTEALPLQSDADVPRQLCEQDIRKHPATSCVSIYLDGVQQHDALSYDIDTGAITRLARPYRVDPDNTYKFLRETRSGSVVVQWSQQANIDQIRSEIAAGLWPTHSQQQIDTGDVVRHQPTGEEWLVAFVRDGRLCACGWPLSLVPVTDCWPVKKATPEERETLLREMATMSNTSDMRQRYAVERLRELAAS